MRRDVDKVIQFPGISFEVSGDRDKRVSITYRGVPSGAWCSTTWTRAEAAWAIKKIRAKARDYSRATS